MEVNEPYLNPSDLPASSGSLTPYDLLKAERDYQRQRRTSPPREYSMRVHEDGSVFFHSRECTNNSELFSFEEVRERVSFASYNMHRPLWLRILKIWL